VLTATWVEQRVAEIGDFYNNTDVISARDFLERYNVRYIVVGQLERAEYSATGIAKFERFDGSLWKEVYRDGTTAIYEVKE